VISADRLRQCTTMHCTPQPDSQTNMDERRMTQYYPEDAEQHQAISPYLCTHVWCNAIAEIDHIVIVGLLDSAKSKMDPLSPDRSSLGQVLPRPLRQNGGFDMRIMYARPLMANGSSLWNVRIAFNNKYWIIHFGSTCGRFLDRNHHLMKPMVVTSRISITTRFAEFNTGEYVIRNVKNVLRIQIGVCAVRRLEVFLVENLLAET